MYRHNAWNLLRSPRTLVVIAAALVLEAGALVAGVAAPAPRQATPEPLDPAKLAPIVGEGQWKLVERFKGSTQVVDLDGRPVLSNERGAASIVSPAPTEGDTEISVRFRMQPHEKDILGLNLDTSLADPADAKNRGVFLTIGNRNNPTAVTWSGFNATPAPGARPFRSGNYRVGFSAERSLGWPESVRRQIEADMAAAEKLDGHWFTLRVALHPQTADFSIDGIPLYRTSRADLKTSGFVRLGITPHVQVASLTIKKLATSNTKLLYEPIPLEPIVNTGTVGGKKVNLSSLPPNDGMLEMGTVPFLKPRADEKGRDHVDIGASWLRQGNLEGRFSGDRDPFGGRWAGALERDPARLQLRVPGGRYRALHLLAAADGEANSVPRVTAQFFKNSAGFPVNFVSPPVPAVNAIAAGRLLVDLAPVKLDSGAQGNLYHVVIPIDPGKLAAFDDQDFLDLELTKEIKLYRAYPDPLFYSYHGAGLPSSVHVFAATLERPNVEVEFKPGAYANIWTAPDKPNYSLKLRNRSGPARDVEVTLATTSFGGDKTTEQKKTLRLGEPGQETTASLTLTPPCYGYHEVKLTVKDGAQVWEEKPALAYLHEDTRERGDWDFGRGPIFGWWNWAGGHGTPDGEKHILVMGQAGAETMHTSFYEGAKSSRFSDAARALGEKFRMQTFHTAGSGDHYFTGAFAGDLKAKGLEEARKNFIDIIEKRKAPPDKLNRPMFISFYAEPSIGNYTHAVMPDYYGEPDPKFTPAEEDRYQSFLHGFVEGAKILKENYPHVKAMFPYGDPNFPVPFLRRNPEIAKLIGGVTVDIPCFERLPEQQMHQVAIHRMYQSRNEFRKAGIEKPLYAMYEGPCVPSAEGALSWREQSDISIRNSLFLLGYGVDIQTGGFPGFDTSSYWGEQHYGFGVMTRIPLETPKPVYASFATMTRNLNRCNFDGWTPTGSLSVYAMRFKHYKTGKLVHVMWTIRGTRPLEVTVPAGAQVTVTDTMDNATTLPVRGDRVSFTVDASPRYVTGLPANFNVTLGEPDNSDAAPGANAVKLSNPGDGDWKISEQRDSGYEQSHVPHIVRFPGKMSVTPMTAPAAQGGKALSVHLDKQEKARVVMPYYTTLVPPRPIAIPGKASHLGLWVKAASDWGRVVYFLKDAKGEQWISVGEKGAWNCDDIHSWTSFNFDGWRYLRFELPANSPYDSYREAGATWWGSYSSGDSIVDLPVALEKIVVERRTHVVYVNDPQPASTSDVLLGDLYAEYENASDKGPEIVKLSALRMPVPEGVPDLANPIEKLLQTGVGQPVKITGITLPEQDADGTRCFIQFEKHPDAVTYDVWASGYQNGQGALQLGKAWKEPGAQIRGLRPETDFYLFVTYTDKDGKVSKPSAPFKIRLQDLFAQK